MKTKKSKRKQLFSKYSQGKTYLSKSNFRKLLQDYFHVNYSNHVIQSAMEIWGTTRNRRKIISYEDFEKMITMPEGFLHKFSL